MVRYTIYMCHEDTRTYGYNHFNAQLLWYRATVEGVYAKYGSIGGNFCVGMGCTQYILGSWLSVGVVGPILGQDI